MKKKEDKEIELSQEDVSEEKNEKKSSRKEEKEVEVKEVIVEKKSGFNYLEVILIMIITLIIGGFLGSFLTKFGTNVSSSVKNEVELGPYQEFIETYNAIKKEYYEDIDEDQLLDAGIKGMLDFLGDKYSVYMDPEETETFNEEVEGKYEGIGTEILESEDGTISIYTVFEGTPAEKAGLKVGDIIQSIEGESIEGKDSSTVANLIKNSKKKEIRMTVLRGDETLDFVIERAVVELESVTSKVFEQNGKKIGYLSLSVFAANTKDQFVKKLEALEKDKIDALVIDVRGNTGGYLDSVTDISSLFLEKGKIIYQLDTKGIVEQVRDETKERRTYPIAILTDVGSASASEILAGALKESYGAYVVGTATYGKGTVQRAYTLESGATVKYTIQKWLTPDGNWVNEVGLMPTDVVELDDAYFANPSDETDNQLQKALTLVSQS